MVGTKGGSRCRYSLDLNELKAEKFGDKISPVVGKSRKSALIKRKVVTRRRAFRGTYSQRTVAMI